MSKCPSIALQSRVVSQKGELKRFRLSSPGCIAYSSYLLLSRAAFT